MVATRYADATFARTNVTLLNGTNTFVAVAADNLGRSDTNTLSLNLPASVTFLYDQNGNLRTNGTRIFEYDDENQLTRITEPNAWKSEFVYDGKLKMRISKDYTWQGGAWVQTNEVRRVYDGMLVIQERDSFNLPRLTYTRGKDLSGSVQGAGGIGGLLALSDHRSQIPDHNYYHADGNGNVTCLVDANQTIVARYLFDPYGNAVSTAGAKAALNKCRFSTKEENVPSGMIYYGYRWYAPDLQRWLNRDPLATQIPQKIRHWGSKLPIEFAQGQNLYWPFGNDPIDNYDPDGQIVPVLVCAIIAGVLVCGCKKAPPPPDPDGCWASTNPGDLNDRTRGSCDARFSGCIKCCEDKYPVTRSDPAAYEACVKGCEANRTYCRLN